MTELTQATARQLRAKLEAREISARELMQSVLKRIEEREPQVRAFITLRSATELLGEADRVDEALGRGERLGPLAGIPVAVKDNFCTRGLRTTCASRMLENFVPPYNATVIERLVGSGGAGAILLGKTNLDEFSMGSSTENSAFFTTRNPSNLEYVAGGTSGGSAAAVASGEAILALGSDTGGSIRQPASFCGVVGFKPSYGRVSRYGLVAYGSSLDQIGPLARDVADAAMLFRVIAGHDSRDSTSVSTAVPGDLPMEARGQRYRIGVPKGMLGEGLDADVRRCQEDAVRRLSAAGHEVFDVELPHAEYAIASYYVIACAEASSNLARYDGVRYGHRSKSEGDPIAMTSRSRTEGFGDEVKRRIILGTYALSSGYYDQFYLRAQKVRTLIRRDLEKAFERCDVVLHPVSPSPAFRVGEKSNDPLAMYLSDVYSVTANLAGIPAMSVPCGRTAGEGLPIGLQLSARAFDERTLIGAALELESVMKG